MQNVLVENIKSKLDEVEVQNGVETRANISIDSSLNIKLYRYGVVCQYKDCNPSVLVICKVESVISGA